jgi:hypothetical protein
MMGHPIIIGLFRGTVDFSLGTTPALTSITSNDGFIAKTEPSGMMAKSAELKLIDIFGKVVKRELITNEVKRIKLNLIDFKDGIYFCRVISDGEVLDEGKVIISH